VIYATEGSTKTVLQEVGELCKHVVNVADDCFLDEAGWNMLERLACGASYIVIFSRITMHNCERVSLFYA
jgi:hypothetical protein